MQETILMEKYPVSSLEILKSETEYKSVDAIIDYLKAQIEAHPVATYISTFDHYAHTKSLGENGEINSEILDAKNIICCFGKQLPNPILMAVRPRAIGVAEMAESFVVSFMDAPNPQAHETMVGWVKGVKK